MVRSKNCWTGSVRCAFVLVLFTLGATTVFAQDYSRKASPFDDFRVVKTENGLRLEVLLEDVWYEPLAIDETPIAEILGYCERQWPGQALKRFTEDLVEALVRLGRPPGPAVSLEVRAVASTGGEGVLTLQEVPLSPSKRAAFLDRRGTETPQQKELRKTLSDQLSENSLLLDATSARADLAAFEEGLRDRFAYLDWKGIDLKRELDELAREIPASGRVSITMLRTRLERILMRFGDGHARIAGPSERPRNFPPYLLVAAADGVAAILPDRTALVDDQHPYVVEIDGDPLATWLERVRPRVADGSPQLIHERSLRQLRLLSEIRGEFGLPEMPSVTLGLGATPERVDRVVERSLVSRPPTYGRWPRRETQTLEGNVGYLRIYDMTNETDPLHEAMAAFRETKGLILDVRGNGGGTRNALLAVAGYLQANDEAPWVGNVATYRRAADRDQDHLASRFVHRRDDSNFGDAQRAAIDAFQESFEPEWIPEDPVGDRFSEWHYLVLGRTGDDREYFYDRPVIVLSDAVSFSATDIFLGALRGRPRVTLL
ncbi:MAG: S41 family peptidase [Acidobacteriota bacterium]